MVALVTGVNGFVGKHLVRELKGRGVHVVGLGREAASSPELKDLLDDYWACDLMDKASLSALPLEKIDVIISLAGLARVGDSFSEQEKYKSINVGVLANLCKVLVDKKIKPRVIAVSTGAVYDSNQPMPLTEQSKLIKDGSPYALSKLAMEKAGKDYRRRGLEIIIARPFNHIGPGQEKGFLLPDLYAKLVAAKSAGGIIKVGNLSTKRDYTDVRDVVRAYADLAQTSMLDHVVYNICSRKSISGQALLDLLLQKTGLAGEIKFETDKSLLRPSDAPDLYGSYERLQNQTGWKPEIPLEKTVADFIKS